MTHGLFKSFFRITQRRNECALRAIYIIGTRGFCINSRLKDNRALLSDPKKKKKKAKATRQCLSRRSSLPSRMRPPTPRLSGRRTCGIHVTRSRWPRRTPRTACECRLDRGLAVVPSKRFSCVFKYTFCFPSPSPYYSWRNRDNFFAGHEAIVQFLTDKWAKELGYRLRKELFAFTDNKIAVNFWYEYHDESGQVIISYYFSCSEFDSLGFHSH